VTAALPFSERPNRKIAVLEAAIAKTSRLKVPNLSAGHRDSRLAMADSKAIN
jgi:hypothetical protein